MTLQYRHSEARTPKNLKFLHTRWVAVVMDRPSEGDIRFLTPFGMTEGGVRNDSGEAVRHDRGRPLGMTMGDSG